MTATSSTLAKEKYKNEQLGIAISLKDKTTTELKASNLQLALQARTAKEEANKTWVSIT